MKRLLNFIVYSIAILALSSCEFFNEKTSSQDTNNDATTVEGISQEIKNKIAAQDTLMNTLVMKVDTLAQALTQAQKDNAELKEKVAELKSPRSTWAYVSISAFVLGLAALIIALFKPKGVKEEKVYDIVKDCLDNSRRITELQTHVKNLLLLQKNNRTSTYSSYGNSNESRICLLERQMAQIVAMGNKNNSISQPIQEVPKSQREPEYQKTGYAKNDMGMYFTTIYNSNQEVCVFKISFTSLNRGRFNLISLDKIQSRNDWQQKVECSGISIKDASDFRVEEEGICEKIDENTWQVTKPLKIRLLK